MSLPKRLLCALTVLAVPRQCRWPTFLSSADITFPATTVVLVVLACSAGPGLIALPEPVGGRVLDSGLPIFSPGHVLGTDLNGNDILSRLLHGGRISLGIAVGVNLMGLLLGGSIGAFSAYLGGTTDSVIMRVLDALIAFPALVLALVVVQSLGPGILNTIWALTLFSIPAFARVARAETLRMRAKAFMIAAELCGTRRLRVLAWHVIPNVLPRLTTFALLGVGVVIVVEGALSFLGLGVPAPRPSWGNMIYQGQQALLTRPALVIMPSLFLFVSVLSFNLLGEALRSRWNRS